MEIKKFENYEPNDGFDYPYGGHTFVLAKYKNGWNNFKGSFFLSFNNDEFVPCMVSGNPTSPWSKRSIYICGDQHSHDITEFEIIPGSNKEIEKLIEVYTNSKKYNL